MPITAAQLWYVTQVYAEHVTREEATEDYQNYLADISNTESFESMDGTRHYWETAAEIINKLVLDKA